MVLVNNPNLERIYWALGHAAWHGWTPTDLVSRLFLFIVGVAIRLLSETNVSGGSKQDLYLKVIRRTLIMFCPGIFLSGFPYFELSTIRIPVYFSASPSAISCSIIFLNTKISASHHHDCLARYLLVAHDTPARTGIRRRDRPRGSVASFVDRAVFGRTIGNKKGLRSEGY
jgi:hypothetical protein